MDFYSGAIAPAYADIVTGQHANELAADIWESDEELDAFLADLRVSRDSSRC